MKDIIERLERHTEQAREALNTLAAAALAVADDLAAAALEIAATEGATASEVLQEIEAAICASKDAKIAEEWDELASLATKGGWPDPRPPEARRRDIPAATRGARIRERLAQENKPPGGGLTAPDRVKRSKI